MNTISRRICGALLGLGVLGLIVPVVPADDMHDEECRRKAQEEREAADRAYQQAQAEQAARDRAYYEAQQERAAQDKAQAERESWDKYNREWQQTQDERAAWYKSNEEARQWQEWMNRGREDSSAAGSNSTNAQVTRPVARSAGLVILNPFALEKMTPKDQQRVRQQARQTGLQVIENPFARSPK